MEWNLMPILNCDGKRMPVVVSLPLSGHQGDDFRILEPVEVRGEIVNIGGCLEFSAECKARLRLVCDRCAEPYVTVIEFPVQERMKKADAFCDSDPDSDPDILTIEGNTVDLDEIIYGWLYLSLPTKALCREDCKGLCPQCGRNLNQGMCSCDNRPTDPRFDILDQLL